MSVDKQKGMGPLGGYILFLANPNTSSKEDFCFLKNIWQSLETFGCKSFGCLVGERMLLHIL